MDHNEPGHSEALGKKPPGLLGTADVFDHGVAQDHIKGAIDERQSCPVTSHQGRSLFPHGEGDGEVGDGSHPRAIPQQAALDLIACVAASNVVPTVAFDSYGENSGVRRHQRQDRLQLVRTGATRDARGYPTNSPFGSGRYIHDPEMYTLNRVGNLTVTMTTGQLGIAPTPATTMCPVCGRRGRQRGHSAQERMFGMGGSFTYHECPHCGSLTLKDVPARLSDYYPGSYYSRVERGQAGQARAAAAVRGCLMRLMLANRVIARAIATTGGAVGIHVEPWTQLLGGSGLDLCDRVLDVGCGDGHRLRTLRRFGFRYLTGIDAHTVRELDDDGIDFPAKGLGQLEGVFDLIMFHHSFEHMADPMRVLGEVNRLLAPDGLLLLRVPLAGSWAWRTYGMDWVQLDAPRHLFLFTAGGLETLAGRAGFQLQRQIYDSGPFQFWGSELYRAGVSLRDSGSVDGAAPTAIPRRQVEQWRRQAKQLNTAQDGDQAAFLFTKASRMGLLTGDNQ